ncbi:hypothetical protein BaRGS_00007363 [Batillaria attramentaria]|uniref:Uncharacterized protein n=1 Tax=Batillaria attramentaria TaxID=370345 RepID=A0ABD0LPS9_9CAEN
MPEVQLHPQHRGLDLAIVPGSQGKSSSGDSSQAYYQSQTRKMRPKLQPGERLLKTPPPPPDLQALQAIVTWHRTLLVKPQNEGKLDTFKRYICLACENAEWKPFSMSLRYRYRKIANWTPSVLKFAVCGADNERMLAAHLRI